MVFQGAFVNGRQPAGALNYTVLSALIVSRVAARLSTSRPQGLGGRFAADTLMDELLVVSPAGVLFHPFGAVLKHCRRELVLDVWMQIDPQPLHRAGIQSGKRRPEALRVSPYPLNAHRQAIT